MIATVKPKKPKPKPVAAPPGQFTTPDLQAWQHQAQRMGAPGAVQPNGFTAADNAAIQNWGANMAAGRPLNAGLPGGPAAPPAPANPRDSQYFADVARGQRARDQGLAALDQAHGYDTADLAEALRRLRDARPHEEVGAKVGANKQGLFYSSTLGNQLADIATNYQRQENDAQSAFDRREADRASQRTGLQDAYTDTEADALRTAIGRSLGTDTTAADQGALAAPAPAAAAAPAGQTVTRPSAAHGGQRWRFRVRPSDGKLIPIGPA